MVSSTGDRLADPDERADARNPPPLPRLRKTVAGLATSNVDAVGIWLTAPAPIAPDPGRQRRPSVKVLRTSTTPRGVAYKKTRFVGGAVLPGIKEATG